MAQETPNDRRVYADFQSRFEPRTYRGSPSDRSTDADEARDIYRTARPPVSRYYDPGGRDQGYFRKTVREDLRMARGNVRPGRRNGRR